MTKISEFGRALKQELRANRRTQSWLADQVGVSGAAVSQWVRGTTEPTRDMVFSAERALGLAPGTLSRSLGYLPTDAVEVVDEELPVAWENDKPKCPSCGTVGMFRNIAQCEDMRSLAEVDWRPGDDPNRPATWVFDGYPEYTDADAGWIECSHCYQRIEWPLPPHEVVWGE